MSGKRARALRKLARAWAKAQPIPEGAEPLMYQAMIQRSKYKALRRWWPARNRHRQDLVTGLRKGRDWRRLGVAGARDDRRRVPSEP